MDGVICARCGANVRESHETVPYIAPGPCAVELRDITVRRCVQCGEMRVHVPDPHGLDVLVRCLRVESTGSKFQLEHEDGHWRVAGRNRINDRSEGLTT